jgi:hypothetical protein
LEIRRKRRNLKVVLLTAGSGKTTLAKNYPTLFLDADDYIGAWEAVVELRPLRKEAVAGTVSWDLVNDRTKRYMEIETDKIVLAHSTSYLKGESEVLGNFKCTEKEINEEVIKRKETLSDVTYYSWRNSDGEILTRDQIAGKLLELSKRYPPMSIDEAEARKLLQGAENINTVARSHDVMYSLIWPKVQTKVIVLGDRNYEQKIFSVLAAQGLGVITDNMLYLRSYALLKDSKVGYSDFIESEQAKIDVVWRAMSIVELAQHTAVVFTKENKYVEYVLAPLWYVEDDEAKWNEPSIRYDKVMKLNTALDLSTKRDNGVFGKTSATGQKAHVGVGNAMRNAVKHLATKLGMATVVLGAEIESVVAYWNRLDTTFYGNVKKLTPMKMMNDKHEPFMSMEEILNRFDLIFPGRLVRHSIRKAPSFRVKGEVVCVWRGEMISDWWKGNRRIYVKVKDAKKIPIGVAQYYLMLEFIEDRDMFDVSVQETEGKLVTALFAPSNTINRRGQWKNLMLHEHCVLTLPYRRFGEEEIWVSEYSDYTYTADELSPFMSISEFIRMYAPRGTLDQGYNNVDMAARRWAVIYNRWTPERVQTFVENQTHWVKVLTIRLRNELGHTDETLHAIRRYVALLYGQKGEENTVAGHMINMMLTSHIYPVDVLRYVNVVNHNLDKPGARREVEPFEISRWHTTDDWWLAVEVYLYMAKGMGLTPNYKLADMVRGRLGF